LWFSLRDASKILGHKKTINHARVIFQPYAKTPAHNGAIVLNYGVRGDIADVITHVKFCLNFMLVKCFGAVTPPNLELEVKYLSKE